MSGLKFKDNANKPVYCPSCEKELEEVRTIEAGGPFRIHMIYACPLCNKIISIGYTFNG